MGTTRLESCGRPPTGGRCCAQVAFQQADYVAWNLWAAINRRPLLRFQYQHLGDMMSLGRRDGAVALPFAALVAAPPCDQRARLPAALRSGPLAAAEPCHMQCQALSCGWCCDGSEQFPCNVML